MLLPLSPLPSHGDGEDGPVSRPSAALRAHRSLPGVGREGRALHKHGGVSTTVAGRAVQPCDGPRNDRAGRRALLKDGRRRLRRARRWEVRGGRAGLREDGRERAADR